jgi:acyl carrier protein
MNNRDEIFQKIVDVFEELFEIDPSTIQLESNLYEELDIDSIDAVDLVIELRKITGKKIQPDEFKQVRTVEDIVDQIDALLNP